MYGHLARMTELNIGYNCSCAKLNHFSIVHCASPKLFNSFDNKIIHLKMPDSTPPSFNPNYSRCRWMS